MGKSQPVNKFNILRETKYLVSALLATVVCLVFYSFCSAYFICMYTSTNAFDWNSCGTEYYPHLLNPTKTYAVKLAELSCPFVAVSAVWFSSSNIIMPKRSSVIDWCIIDWEMRPWVDNENGKVEKPTLLWQRYGWDNLRQSLLMLLPKNSPVVYGYFLNSGYLDAYSSAAIANSAHSYPSIHSFQFSIFMWF